MHNRFLYKKKSHFLYIRKGAASGAYAAILIGMLFDLGRSKFNPNQK